MSLYSRFAVRRPALTLDHLEDRDVPSATVDLTHAGAAGAINGALFRQYTPAANAGPVDSFLRIHDVPGPTEQGYNTDHRPLQFDESRSHDLTHSIRVDDLPLVTIGQTQYRELILDVNEPAGRRSKVSLDELRVYVSDNPQLHGYRAHRHTLGGLHPVYDMGHNNWVKIDAALNNQRGTGDVLVDVPANLLTGGTYLTLYSKFGEHVAADGGYEEWGPGIVRQVGVPTTVSGVAFSDENNDGMNEGEPPLAGWTVRLMVNGVEVARGMTGTDGSYSLTASLTVGGDFTVELAPPGSDTFGYSVPGSQPLAPGDTQTLDLAIFLG
jgi:hypothetical protein